MEPIMDLEEKMDFEQRIRQIEERLHRLERKIFGVDTHKQEEKA